LLENTIEMVKSFIKSIINRIGWFFYHLLNNDFLVLIGDASLKYKILEKRNISLGNELLTFHTPNFLMRYRYRTFYSKEPETLEWIDQFESNTVFLDIGANVGLYSIYAAKTKNITVYAFEPSFFNLEYLARNIYINGLSEKINIIPLALNNKPGINSFHLTSTEWGGALSTFDQKFDDGGKEMHPEFVYKTTGIDLDTLSNLFQLEKADYVKIDVDGLEHIILIGAKNTLKNAREILVEINDNFNEQREVSTKILIELGFQLDRKVYTEVNTKQVANQIWKKNT